MLRLAVSGPGELTMRALMLGKLGCGVKFLELEGTVSGLI